MSDSHLTVAFVGIPKREEILLRSFLNLADSDFGFSVEIGDEVAEADILVVDESALADDFPGPDSGQRCIVLGTNEPHGEMGYVARPLHWSTFRSVLEETVTGDVPTDGEPDTGPDLYLEPNEPVTEESAELTEEVPLALTAEEAPDEPDLEAGGVTEPDTGIHLPGGDDAPGEVIDVESLEMVGGDPAESVSPPGARRGTGDSSGDDDRSRGREGEEPAIDDPDQHDKIALKLSDEDESPPRTPLSDKDFEDETMVMETDAIEAWTISIEAELETISQSLDYRTRAHLAREREPRKSPVVDLGVRLPPGIQFWEGDAEILLGGSPLFLIDETGQRLYSDSPIREWTKILRERNLTRRDLSPGWYVDPSVKSSPLPWFVWCSAQARSKGRLLPAIDPDQEYLLEKWPHFELIRNDNQSLKLCALLFSRPESVKTLVAKSDIRARKVVAFMNACHLLGLIKMTGIDEAVVWNNTEEPRSMTLMQRLRRNWGM